jgi:hypothetical protein
MATYTTTSAPLPWQEPYLQDYMGRAMDLANQPYNPSPQTYTGPNNALQASWQATANRAMQGSPVMSQANQQLTNIMGGGFMGGNPFLNQQIESAQGDLLRSYNLMQKPAWDKAMQGSGSFGNTGVMEYQQNAQNDLMRNLGRIGSDMRFQNYATERGLMQNALGMAPTFANQDYVDANALQNVGQQMQGFDQGQADQNYRWWQESQNFPRQQLAQYGQALGVGGGGTQTQTAPDPSKGSQLLGGALTGAALYKMLFGGP